MSAELAGWTVAVIGGDRRMLEIMPEARAAGARVQHYRSAPGADAAAANGASPSLAEAVRGARLIVCPARERVPELSRA